MALAGPVNAAGLRPWFAKGTVLPDIALSTAGSPVTELATGLLDRGHEIVVVSLQPGLDRAIRVGEGRLRLHLLPWRTRGRARDAFARERRHVRMALTSEEVDLVHAHWAYEYALGALGTSHPVIVTVRDWAPTVWRLQRPKHYLTVRLGMAICALIRAKHFTVTSHYMQERVSRFSRQPVPVIPNAMPEERFAARKRGLRQQAPTLLAVNQGFSKRKNVRTLLQAFSRLRHELPAAQLVLVGDRYEVHGPAWTWASEQSLLEGVQFRGPVHHEEVIELMREVDLFVHPALEESFGMVLVEAMAQGLPVVAGLRSGAVPSVLDEGAVGCLTDVSDEWRLFADLAALLKNERRWRNFSEAAYASAWQRFRSSVVLDAYEETYRNVVASV